MGFLFALLTSLLHGIIKLAGLRLRTIEIEPGTIMNIWVPKESIINVDGKPIYEQSKKPAVLLVHCFAMDGIFIWFAQVLALTRNYSVYVPDLLFFGGSTTDRTERSVSFQAEFLAKGMEILGVEKVNLVGLSYGGIVGFEMAKLYPKLVHSLVVTGSVTELTESISQESLKLSGVSSWADMLLPETMEGFKRMLSFGAHKLPWIPSFVYCGLFEVFLVFLSCSFSISMHFPFMNYKYAKC
ncbi:Alpha/beta hydrolase fold-1 [Artemisia annua]|uniref:Alpha/beta hydrolase fold-1 n=1 Tax=Artemisia annua TaxID=35608 RepID=A0A2U1LID3_ARTAN|nr:Alpha/beta hydrolase fold-1 [Artemisia annua]